MYIKNIPLVFAFITYSLLALSSPVRNNNDVAVGETGLDVQSDYEKDIATFSVEEISDDETLINEDELSEYPTSVSDTEDDKIIENVIPSDEFRALTDDFKITEFRGDYGFDTFLENGSSSDTEVVYFALGMIPQMIQSSMMASGYNDNIDDISALNDGITVNQLEGVRLGCSTIHTPKKNEKGYFFGRNFDWSPCNKTVIVTRPLNGYASVSTSKTDLLMEAIGQELPDIALKAAIIYAPLDGMNEKGVGISVNEVLVEGDTIHQNDENKKNITTTTAVRMILDKADSVDKAIELLESYNLHASFEVPVHFSITDNTGRAVVIEYVDNKMNVIESPINENFYLTPNQEEGISRRVRYEILKNNLEKNPQMTFDQVRDNLQAVGQKVIREFTSTEWSIVFDQENKEATYYNREDFNHGYRIEL